MCVLGGVVAVAFGSWFLKQEEMLYYTPKEQQFSNDSVFFLSASDVFFSFLILTFLPKVLYLEPAGKPRVLQVTGSQRVRHDWATEQRQLVPSPDSGLRIQRGSDRWVLLPKSLSRLLLFVTPWAVAHQTPLSVEFSSQEYWIVLPFPSPGNLPDPRIEPRSPALQADSLPSEPRWMRPLP